MPAARPSPPSALALGGALAVTLVLAIPAGEARAVCAPDPAVAGDTVTCSAADGDGFDAGAVDELDVVVEAGATVGDTGVDNTPGLRLNDMNNVQVQTGGAITTSGMDSHGIEIGNDNFTDPDTVGATHGVTNEGVITVTGDNAGGVLGVDHNDVTNSGTISAGGAGVTGAFGIRLGNDAFITTDANTSIDVTGPGSVGIEIGNDMLVDPDLDPDAVDPDPEQNEITNRGSLTVNGETGAATGIIAGNENEILNTGTINVSVDAGGTAIGVQLDNDNTFENNGALEVNGTGGRAVVITGAGQTNTIRNLGFGTITVDEDGGPAIDLSGAAIAETHFIENFGSITAGSVDTPGVAILGSSGVDDVTNSGAITGDVQLGDGDDVLSLEPGATGTGDLDGQGDADEFHLIGNGFESIDLGRVMNFETLMFGVAGGDAPVWTLSGAGTFSTETRVHAGAVRLLDTVTLDTGIFSLENDSALRIVVDPSDPMAVVNGRLNLVGAAATTMLGPSTRLEIEPLSPILGDTTLIILDTSATGTSITGTFGSIPGDTPILTFNLLELDLAGPVGTDRLSLEILRASYGVVGETPNQRATGRYLDRVLQSSSNNVGVQGALLALDLFDAPTLRNAYDFLQPEAYDAHTSSMVALGRAFADAAARPRLLCKPPFVGLDPGPHVDLPCGRTGFSAWMRLLLSEADRDAGSDFFESDASSQAVAGGFDWRPDRRVQVTGYVGIGSSDIEVDDVGRGEVQSFEIGTAVHARLGGARARAAFGYGRGNHEQDRRGDFGLSQVSTDAEFDSNRIHTLIELGWLFEYGGFQFEPLFGLDVTWIAEDAFDETDTSASNLTFGTELAGIELEVDERENTIVSTEFGGRVLYRHHQSAYSDSVLPVTQGTWTTELSARWRSTWLGADRELDAQLAGAGADAGSFSVDAEDSEQGVDVGARVTFQPHGSGGSLSIGYDGFIGDKGINHRFGGELEVYF